MVKKMRSRYPGSPESSGGPSPRSASRSPITADGGPEVRGFRPGQRLEIPRFAGLTGGLRGVRLASRAMILDIVQYGHPVLRQRCRKVSEIDDDTIRLVEDMLETMVDANGVGLAAPQVGVPIRLAVIDVSHDPECVSYLRVNGEDADLVALMPLVFINPELEFGDTREFGTEGCLSIQGIRAEVKRPAEVTATLPQLDGSVLVVETDGLLARALQHEIDHLNGVLFVDRLPPAAKVSLRGRLKLLMERNQQP